MSLFLKKLYEEDANNQGMTCSSEDYSERWWIFQGLQTNLTG